MRFLVMVKGNPEHTAAAEKGDYGPNFAEDLAAMGAFNETLVRDGVLLDMGGLQPTSKGARIGYAGGKAKVTDGPFAETKELVAGFWLLQARSKEEIVERLSHCPFMRGESIEIRQLFEPEEIAELVK